MTLALSLQQKGFDVVIIDPRTLKETLQQDKRTVADSLCGPVRHVGCDSRLQEGLRGISSNYLTRDVECATLRSLDSLGTHLICEPRLVCCGGVERVVGEVDGERPCSPNRVWKGLCEHTKATDATHEVAVLERGL